jgi:predicted enzyme related to lactoylglutathione lyase
MGQPVVHFEIGCRDRERSERFFGELFGWSFEQAAPASMIDTGARAGIKGHITALGHEPHHYVTVYIEVDDVRAYLERAEALGGKTLVPPVDIPDGTFAWFADPDGNTLGLWRPNRSS